MSSPTPGVVLAVLTALAASPGRAASPAEPEGPPRLSLPTESDRAAWLRPGFRFALGAGYGRLFGLDGAPSGDAFGPTLRLGLRLDERWSLLGSLQYLFAFGSAGLTGVRFGGTLEPTWHVTPRLSLAVGLGFGGIVEGTSDRPAPTPTLGRLGASYTFPDRAMPLGSCSGVGVVGLVRGEYLFVLGPRSSTGLALELDGQWTACVEDTGEIQPDTAEPIVMRQWWPHLGLSLSWVVAWR